MAVVEEQDDEREEKNDESQSGAPQVKDRPVGGQPLAGNLDKSLEEANERHHIAPNSHIVQGLGKIELNNPL